MYLNSFKPEYTSNLYPAWAEFAKLKLQCYLETKMPVISNLDELAAGDSVLFIGETSERICEVVRRKCHPYVIALTSDPFAYIPSVMHSSINFYGINSKHAEIIKQKSKTVETWKLFPKPFEPPRRHRKLVGILEPDLYSSLFLNLFRSIVQARIQGMETDFDIVFYTFTESMHSILLSSLEKTDIRVISMQSDDSPDNKLSSMPNVAVSFDLNPYNPVLSSWGQVMPVIRQSWMDDVHKRQNVENMLLGRDALLSIEQIDRCVNIAKRIEELEHSSNVPDILTRNTLLGGDYGDYRNFRNIPHGG